MKLAERNIQSRSLTFIVAWMGQSNDAAVTSDLSKVMELKKRVKDLEEENEQMAFKLEKTNRLLNRLVLEKQ